ncbi:MAG: GDSL-type esterase/lipase family protein [Clostridiales bacterium]|nr:GDSL-type esterase/lipase family protein [Clostridiales bacterium]
MKQAELKKRHGLFSGVIVIVLLLCLATTLFILRANGTALTGSASTADETPEQTHSAEVPENTPTQAPSPEIPEETPEQTPEQTEPLEEQEQSSIVVEPPKTKPPLIKPSDGDTDEKESENGTSDNKETSPLTLMIGDSRTVGLRDYAEMEDAVFFCATGMNVYQLFWTTVDVPDMGSTDLKTLLAEMDFGRIHLMLGINELGYDFDTTVKVYQEAVDKLRELQPDAVIYLGANLHVSQERSDNDKLYNNENIDRFNQSVARMADGEHVVYVDVNALFDEDGALAAGITGDGVHVLGSCYKTWGQWLYEIMENEERN